MTELESSLDAVPAPKVRPKVVDPATFPDLPPLRVPKARHPLWSPSPKEHPTLGPYCRAKTGRSAHLAKLLGVHPSLITLWARGRRRITLARCYHIEEVTKGILTCEMLRPDLIWKRWSKSPGPDGKKRRGRPKLLC